MCGPIGNIVTADQLGLSIRNIDVFGEMLRKKQGIFNELGEEDGLGWSVFAK